MRKKSFLGMCLFVLMAMFLVACNSETSGSEEEKDSQNDETSESGENITIDLVSTLPEAEHSILLDGLAENFKENSDGRIEFNKFTDGVLGGEAEGMKQVSSGEVNMAIGVLHSSLYYPEYDAPGVPYLFSNYDNILEYMNGPIGEKIDEVLLEEANMVQIGYYLSGPRWMTANKPIERAADIDGLKIRLSENPLHIGVWEELGAVITPMPSPDVFSALQTGVIDSQENWLSNISGRHLNEAQDYLMKTDHILSFGTVLVNNDWWTSLSDSDREMIQTSVSDALEHANSFLEDEQQRIVDSLINEGGMELVEPDVTDIRDAAESGINKVIDEELAPEVKEELQDMGIIK